MQFHITRKSDNAKTGPIAATVSSRDTCPTTCPTYGKCYAEYGPLGLHWNKVSTGERGGTWQSLVYAIADLPAGQAWRHNQAGDLPGYGNAIDAGMLAELVEANAGKRGWTYTHKPVTPANLRAIRAANAGGFTINLSANTLAQADYLHATGAGPVVVIVPRGSAVTQFTPMGRKVVVCPAQRSDSVTCESCMLCQRVNRSVIVGFIAHGTGAKHAEAACRA